MMFLPRRNGATIAEVKKSRSFLEIKALSDIREKLPVLRNGNFIPLWVDNDSGTEDDGVFAFARAAEDGSSFVVVVVNASNESRVTGAGNLSLQLPHPSNQRTQYYAPFSPPVRANSDWDYHFRR